MINKLSLLVVISAIIAIIYIPANAQDLTIGEKVYLVRHPEFVKGCAPKTNANAVLIFDKQKINRKDRVSIVSHTQGAIDATITNILSRCEPFFEDDQGDLALLYTAKKIDWLSDIDALLAVKDTKSSEGNIGIVRQYSLGKKEPLFLNEIKKYIPNSDQLAIDNIREIILPGTKSVIDNIRGIIFPGTRRKHIFIAISHFNVSEYEKAGDQALHQKGFIFSFKEGTPQLLLKEDYLTNVFTVSKLLSDSSYEILIHSGGYGGGTYELRFFDGDKFMQNKIVLYEWMH